MDKQQIIFPSEEEKEKSISFIVAKGMPKPHRFFRELYTMFQAVGFRGMFFGVGDSIFLAVLCTIFSLCGSVLLMYKSENGIVISLFLVSPFLYGIVQAMTTWKDWMTGVYEQKMVCRYTLRQVNTLRMLFFWRHFGCSVHRWKYGAFYCGSKLCYFSSISGNCLYCPGTFCCIGSVCPVVLQNFVWKLSGAVFLARFRDFYAAYK